MNDLRYECETRRLRFAGAVAEADLEDLQDAVLRFVDRVEGHLMIDFTAVTDLADSAARWLVEAKGDAECRGRRVVLLRKLDSVADRALCAVSDAEQRAGRRT